MSSVSSTSTPPSAKQKKNGKKKSASIPSPQASPLVGAKGIKGKTSDSTSNVRSPTPSLPSSPPKGIAMSFAFSGPPKESPALEPIAIIPNSPPTGIPMSFALGNGPTKEVPPASEPAPILPNSPPKGKKMSLENGPTGGVTPALEPAPTFSNFPPKGIKMGFMSGPTKEVPRAPEPAPISPIILPHEATPPVIPEEVPWLPQGRLSEVPEHVAEAHVADEEKPKSSEALPNIPTCKDCSLPTDVVLSSSDGVLFGAHTRNLELYSGGFLAHVPLDGANHVVKVEENSTVLPLLLRYMHLCPQPDPKAMPFSTLEQLANAVEKYLIYSAMAICKLRMEFYLEEYPAEVLRYAAKNRYTDLANEAALLTIGFDYGRIKEAFGGDADTPRRWLEFKEGWRSALTYAHLTEPEDVPHPTNPLCSWDSFREGVLKEIGPFNPSTLRKIEATFASKRDATFVGPGCMDCETRMSKWETGIISQRDALPQFSAFL